MDPVILLIGSGFLGLIAGSFLNVVIYRLPREGLSIIRPRSHCVHCGYKLRWFDNIPILSFALLRGRCRSCRIPISLRYPFVEALTCILFLFFTYWHLVRSPSSAGWKGWIVLLVHLSFVCALLALTFIDFKFRILPNEITISGIVLSPLLGFCVPELHKPLPCGMSFGSTHLDALASSLSGIVFGAGTIYLIGLLGKMVFRKEAMGFGDVKLMGMIGGFLGPESILVVFFIACLSGSVFGLLTIGYQRLRGGEKESYIPFGPYLSLGAAVSVLFSQELIHFFFRTWPRFIQQCF